MVVPRARRPGQCLRPAPDRPGRRPRRPGGDDDLEPARVRRGRLRRQQGRARPPCCSARRGRPSRSVTPSTSPGRSTRWPTGRPPRCSASCSGRAGSPISTARRRTTPPVDAAPAWTPPATGATTDEAVLVFSSGTTGLPKAVRHTHRSMGHGHRALVRDPGPRARRPVPGGHPAVAHPRAAQPAGRGAGRGHGAAAPPVRPRRGAAPDRGRADDPGDGGGPDRAGHGQPPRPRAVRPVLAALHHVGRDAGERAAWPETVTERTGVRWLPAYGASEVPVIAVNPVDDPGLVAARLGRLAAGRRRAPGGRPRRAAPSSPRAGSGRSRSGARRSWPATSPRRRRRDAFADGWYRTGDVGWLEPEGWVHLTDRSKEMIKVNGFQVAPAEIEGVLHGHPAVLDCAVFGLVDERAGEVPVAVVQLDPDRPLADGRARGAGGRIRWPPTSSCATWSWSRPSRGFPRARCCAGRSATNGRPVLVGRRADR